MMENLKVFREYKEEMFQTVLQAGGAYLGSDVGASILTGLGFAIGGPALGSLAWGIGRLAGIAGGWYVGNKLAKKVYSEISEENSDTEKLRENLLEGGKNDVLKKIQKRDGSWNKEWIQKQSEESHESIGKTGENALEVRECEEPK